MWELRLPPTAGWQILTVNPLAAVAQSGGCPRP
jgi:hypothetical protein